MQRRHCFILQRIKFVVQSILILKNTNSTFYIQVLYNIGYFATFRFKNWSEILVHLCGLWNRKRNVIKHRFGDGKWHIRMSMGNQLSTGVAASQQWSPASASTFSRQLIEMKCYSFYCADDKLSQLYKNLIILWMTLTGTQKAWRFRIDSLRGPLNESWNQFICKYAYVFPMKDGSAPPPRKLHLSRKRLALNAAISFRCCQEGRFAAI